MKPIAINGRFLTQAVTGVQRYAWEVIRAMDALLASGESAHAPGIEVLAPRSTPVDALTKEGINTLPLRLVGDGGGQIWEQLSLPLHCRGRVLWTPTGGSPLIHSDNVFTLPDLGVFATPEAYTPRYRAWYAWHHRMAAWRGQRFITVSEFSRRELERWLRVEPERITVTLEGHEHALRPQAEPSVLERLGLNRGRYLFAVGSANPNKNFKTLLKSYELVRGLMENPPPLVVSGGFDARIFGAESLEQAGVIRTGYIRDGELRALYESAACFVFPSTYEGFGLPPLEAMALGCPVLCSNAASLPEVCGNAALLVDPLDANAICDAMLRLLSNPFATREGKEWAMSFRWKDTARATWNVLVDAAKV